MVFAALLRCELTACPSAAWAYTRTDGVTSNSNNWPSRPPSRGAPPGAVINRPAGKHPTPTEWLPFVNEHRRRRLDADRVSSRDARLSQSPEQLGGALCGETEIADRPLNPMRATGNVSLRCQTNGKETQSHARCAAWKSRISAGT